MSDKKHGTNVQDISNGWRFDVLVLRNAKSCNIRARTSNCSIRILASDADRAPVIEKRIVR